MELQVQTLIEVTLTLSCMLLLYATNLHATTIIPTEALPTRSGYLKVNKTSGSSIFYAFYEAQQPNTTLNKTPLLIWLQGGPGCSSMTGNFYELGPWRVNQSLQLQPNPGAWNRVFGLLFLDNPIGTGFSVASSSVEIPRTQFGVARHLYSAIKGFVRLDKKLFGSRPVFITGESYAGKYGPSIGYHIMRKNSLVSRRKRIVLGGVAVGNGLTDPESQVKTHGVNAYFTGLINERQRSHLEDEQNKVVRLIKEMRWAEATNARSHLLDLLKNMTGLATLYDMRRQIPYESELVEQFLRNDEVRKALGVTEESGVYEECSEVVGKALHEDVMKSVKHKLEALLRKGVRVLLYQGECDLRDGVVSVEAYLKKLKWDGIDRFRGAERWVWRVNGELAGYVQRWGSLSEFVVLGAGHFVPTDQAVHSQVMIEDWVLGRGLFAHHNRIESQSQSQITS